MVSITNPILMSKFILHALSLLPHPLRTLEHQIFSFVSPTTSEREETDCDDFGIDDDRDSKNFMFDEFVDENDECVDDDDDQERLVLDGSIAFDENGDDNPVSFFFLSFYQLICSDFC